MPFTSRDAFRHTHKANTSKLKKLWSKVANSERKKIGDTKAIRAANSVIKKRKK
jgi:hypothetical protein